MKNKPIIAAGKLVIDTELLGVKKLYKSIDKNFDKAVKLLSKVRGRVIITGVGKSGHIASKISSTMSSTGTPSQYCSPTDMSHGDLGIISKKDAIIIISNSGNSNELSDILKFTSKYSILVVGITSNIKSELQKKASVTLLIPDSKEACSIGLAPTTSTTMALILGDALCVSLMKLKKFSISSYRKIHPGGALGVSMLQVKDVMHKKNELPLVGQDATMKSVVIEMTKKSFGHVGVKNKKNHLIGIITDGDLRRHLNNKFFNLKAKDIMTTKPILIDKDLLMNDALKIMNTNKITCLFVINKISKLSPIGIIHIHDCLRYAN